MINKLSTYVLVVLLFGCGTDHESAQLLAPQKLIYTGGSIYSPGINGGWSDALLVNGQRIEYVGDEAQALYMAGENVRRVDLRGGFVFPGFIDSHTHPGLVANFPLEEGVDLEDQRLPQESKELLFQFLERYSKENWYKPVVVLGEWDVNSFMPEGPRIEQLDEYFSLRPTVLMDNSGHSFWLNSSALTLFGIDKDTPDLSPGISYFVRDEHGHPTGWVKEFAMMPYMTDWMVASDSQLRKGIKEYLAFLSQHGVTTLWDAGNFDMDDAVYSVVSELDRNGELPLRYEGSYHIWEPSQLQEAISEFKRLRDTYSGNRLQFNTIKIHFDGVAEIMTAGMLEPYERDPDNRGGVLFDRKTLSNFISQLNDEGIHLHLHTVGDWATREALDAVERARAQNGGPLSIELTLAHLETVSPEDIARFKRLNVNANFTPHWFGGDYFGEAGVLNLGEERAGRSQVANEFVQAGANVTLSSDVVTGAEAYRANPFVGLQMGVTRRDYLNPNGESLAPEIAKLRLNDAISGYTVNGAKQLGLADSLGSLEIGKRADFMVLTRNPFEVADTELHTLKPVLVVVDGEPVYGTIDQ